MFIGGGEQPLSLMVQEELSAVVAAMRGTAEFRRFTDPGGRLHWVNSAAVAYIQEYDGHTAAGSSSGDANRAVPRGATVPSSAGSTV